MPETFAKRQTVAGTTASALYTVPAATQGVVKHLRFVNTSTTQTVTFGLFQGGTAAANRILPDVPLAPGEWAEWDGALFMAAADTLNVIASVAGAITVTGEIVELT